ncbi:MAG: hypothetical protein GYA55_04915, partial [SAR324 cluster bacterium]|nr:hypothetical protein [SAR324 cluster bacterium]
MRRILWILFSLFLGVYITRPISDPDLWWHLTVGKWILHNFRVPEADLWNMFAVGKAWRAYSWSNEVIYAIFEKVWGISGVVILHFLLGWGISLSLFYCLGRISKDCFFGVLLGTVVMAGLVEHFSLRPQSFTWICLIWLIFFADRIYEEGLNRRNGLGLFVFMCLWANSHITTIFGLLAILAWAFDEKKKQQSIWILIIAFGATLITPYMGGEWLTFFSKVDHPLNFVRITEFQPATLLHYSSGILVLLLGFLIALWQRTPKTVSFSKGALIGLAWVAAFYFLTAGHLWNGPMTAAAFVALPAVNAFYALNFTGCT